MKNYITSDLHLCHSNIIKYAERVDYQPFTDESTERMNWDIVNAINKQVPDEKDVVLWNLGDLFYGKMFTAKTLAELKAYIDVMKGKNRTLNIVLGNHDRQFKQWADWKKLRPLTNKSSFTTIFQQLGFTNVYDRPVLFDDKIILSHEPVFLKKDSQFVNVHGHTHQKPLKDSDNFISKYFCYDLENYKMVQKAYKDSGRPVPELSLKKNWEDWLVDCKNYYNVCWDYTKGKVLCLQDIERDLINNNYRGQQ